MTSTALAAEETPPDEANPGVTPGRADAAFDDAFERDPTPWSHCPDPSQASRADNYRPVGPDIFDENCVCIYCGRKWHLRRILPLEFSEVAQKNLVVASWREVPGHLWDANFLSLRSCGTCNFAGFMVSPGIRFHS